MAGVITVPKPDFRVLYGVGDETTVLSPFITRVSVTDNLTGQADDVEITLDNKSGSFISSYFPLMGDELGVAMGWDGGELQGLADFGRFIIDEAQANGPPDQVVIRGISTSNKVYGRSPRSRAFENVTFEEIAKKVGESSGYSIEVGDIEKITFKRISQHRETDLSFLWRLSEEFGLIMKAKGHYISFTPITTMLGLSSGVGVGRKDLINYSIRSKTAETHRATVSRYWDPTKKDQIAFLGPDKLTPPKTMEPVAPGAKKTGTRTFLGSRPAEQASDVAKVFGRVENSAQAQARMDASQMQAAMGNVAGTLNVIGDQRIRAGINVYLYPEDFGVLGGWYLVSRVRHSIDRSSGFTSEMDICHNPKPPAGGIPKPKPATTQKPGKQ